VEILDKSEISLKAKRHNVAEQKKESKKRKDKGKS
jgi:hypothetical protein